MDDKKMKVLLYLKKSSRDRSGKVPIMGRITLGRSIAQFSCKLFCNPDLWNPRESRMDGKSREAVEVNAKLDNLLLAVQSAYQSLLAKGGRSTRRTSRSISKAACRVAPCFWNGSMT